MNSDTNGPVSFKFQTQKHMNLEPLCPGAIVHVNIYTFHTTFTSITATAILSNYSTVYYN